MVARVVASEHESASRIDRRARQPRRIPGDGEGNHRRDVVAGGFDAGIRRGEDLTEGVVAVPLGPRQRVATAAAPGYLAGRKPPRTPDDLREHRCIQVRLQSGLHRCEYAHKGRDFAIETHGPIVTNDGAARWRR